MILLYMDKKDKDIINSMMRLKTNNLQTIAEHVKISKSSVQKRLKKLEEEKIIKGFIPELNEENLPEQLTAISMIRAKYAPDYAVKIGEEISKIEGISSVYYVLGDYDFIVIIKAKGRKNLEAIVNKLSSIERIERSSTITVLSTFREDPTALYRLDD